MIRACVTFRHWRILLLLILPLGVGVVASIESAYLRYPPYRVVDLGDLGAFPLDDQHGSLKDVPEEFRRLDGKTIVVSGMLFHGDPRAGFQLVEFSTPRPNSAPRVQERIFVYPPVTWTPPAGAPFVRVFGKLQVNPKRNAEGTIVSLYELDADQILPGALGPSPRYWLWGLWCSLALMVVVIARRQWQLHRYKVRVANGLCVNCGYDTRAAQDRCSECGCPVAAPWADIVGPTVKLSAIPLDNARA